jgi:hypothetical protein
MSSLRFQFLKLFFGKRWTTSANFYPLAARPRKFSKLNWDSVATVRGSIIIKERIRVSLQPAPRTTRLIYVGTEISSSFFCHHVHNPSFRLQKLKLLLTSLRMAVLTEYSPFLWSSRQILVCYFITDSFHNLHNSFVILFPLFDEIWIMRLKIHYKENISR